MVILTTLLAYTHTVLKFVHNQTNTLWKSDLSLWSFGDQTALTVHCKIRKHKITSLLKRTRNKRLRLNFVVFIEYNLELYWTEWIVTESLNVRLYYLCDDMMVCLNSSWENQPLCSLDLDVLWLLSLIHFQASFTIMSFIARCFHSLRRYAKYLVKDEG